MIEVTLVLVAALLFTYTMAKFARQGSEPKEVPERVQKNVLNEMESFSYYFIKQRDRLSKLMVNGDKNKRHLNVKFPDSLFYQVVLQNTHDANEVNFHHIWSLYQQTLIASYRKLIAYQNHPEHMFEYFQGETECTYRRPLLSKKDIEHFLLYSLPLELHLFELSLVNPNNVPENIGLLRIAESNAPINHEPLKIF